MSLWLCLRLDRLPLNALCREETQPVVVLCKQRVLAANDTAAEYGVEPGQRSTIAQQLLDGQSALWLERDTAREHATLEHLLGWAYSFSPAVQSWEDNCLLLEIGGCLSLFGGVDRLLARALGELSRRGFTAQAGIAETRRAAWLLSHSLQSNALAAEQPLLDRLGPLPLTLLTSFDREVQRLERAGITCFGDLLRLPSRARGQRCSAELRRWLEQLTGTQREVSVDHQPPAVFTDTLWFGFEIRQCDELLPAMAELLQKFHEFSQQTQLETQSLCWQLLKMRGTGEHFEVRSSGTGLDWHRWLELSSLRLSTLQITRDIEGIALQVDTLLPLNAATTDLFADQRYREPRQALVDRLRSRLGLEAIQHISSRSEHLPEHCLSTGAEIVPPTDAVTAAQRPFWLLPQPQPITQRNGALFCNGVLQLRHGPERIEDYWWHTPISRDYYIAEREENEPVWVFQDRRSKRWYLHGLFE